MLSGDNATLNNINLTGNTVPENFAYVYGWDRGYTIRGGSITDNRVGSGGDDSNYYSIQVKQGKLTLDGSLAVVGNTQGGVQIGQVYVGGEAAPSSLTVNSAVSIQGVKGEHPHAHGRAGRIFRLLELHGRPGRDLPEIARSKRPCRYSLQGDQGISSTVAQSFSTVMKPRS